MIVPWISQTLRRYSYVTPDGYGLWKSYGLWKTLYLDCKMHENINEWS